MRLISAAMPENMWRTSTGRLSKQWSEPQRFPQFPNKMGKIMGAPYDWSAKVKRLLMPVMLIFADNDSVWQKHIAEFFALLGGGVKEPQYLRECNRTSADYRQIPRRSITNPRRRGGPVPSGARTDQIQVAAAVFRAKQPFHFGGFF